MHGAIVTVCSSSSSSSSRILIMAQLKRKSLCARNRYCSRCCNRLQHLLHRVFSACAVVAVSIQIEPITVAEIVYMNIHDDDSDVDDVV